MSQATHATSENGLSESSLEYITPKPSVNEQLRISVYPSGQARFYKAAARELGLGSGDRLRFAQAAASEVEETESLYLQVIPSEHLSDAETAPAAKALRRQTVEVNGGEERTTFRARGVFEALGVNVEELGSLLYQIHAPGYMIDGFETYELELVEVTPPDTEDDGSPE
jgi:hypothetical protein